MEDWKIHIPACGDKPAREEWVSVLQSETCAKALRMEGPPLFECEFSLQMAPTTVGGKATSLWVCFSRVVDWLCGTVKGGGDGRLRAGKMWSQARTDCEARGLDAQHFKESSLSVRKRSYEDMQGDDIGGAIPRAFEQEALTGAQDWLLSVRALIFWLWECTSRGYVVLSRDADTKAEMLGRGRNLLGMMLRWALGSGDKPDVCMESKRGNCVT
eukprot:9500594-Pyramimonas_sp.AAC.1